MLSGRHALITDFGVARAVSEATNADTLTTMGVALGTPSYMSPEQATADPAIDHRADIYAVGVLAYELLAGRLPFSGTPQQVLAAHVTEMPEPVQKHRPGISPALSAAVMRCLAKLPADRWQSASELLGVLEPLATPSGGLEPTSARLEPVARPAPSRKKWLVAAAAIGIVAVVGAPSRSRRCARSRHRSALAERRSSRTRAACRYRPPSRRTESSSRSPPATRRARESSFVRSQAVARSRSPTTHRRWSSSRSGRPMARRFCFGRSAACRSFPRSVVTRARSSPTRPVTQCRRRAGHRTERRSCTRASTRCSSEARTDKRIVSWSPASSSQTNADGHRACRSSRVRPATRWREIPVRTSRTRRRAGSSSFL